MFRNLIITKPGLLSLLTVILFTGVNVSANEKNPEMNKAPESVIVQLKINPSNLILYPGGSYQLVASAYDINGKKIVVTPSWRIKSDVLSFGELDKLIGTKVYFNAISSGCGSILAVYNDIEAEVHVEIFKPGHSNKQLHKPKKPQ